MAKSTSRPFLGLRWNARKYDEDFLTKVSGKMDAKKAPPLFSRFTFLFGRRTTNDISLVDEACDVVNNDCPLLFQCLGECASEAFMEGSCGCGMHDFTGK
jgi:hypothetical protein